MDTKTNFEKKLQVSGCHLHVTTVFDQIRVRYIL